MALIRKANVVLEIKDTDIDRYLGQGYLLIDDKGNVLKEGEPQDLESYRRAYVEQRSIIAKLTAEIEALKKSNTAKTTKKTATKDTVTVDGK